MPKYSAPIKTRRPMSKKKKEHTTSQIAVFQKALQEADLNKSPEYFD